MLVNMIVKSLKWKTRPLKDVSLSLLAKSQWDPKEGCPLPFHPSSFIYLKAQNSEKNIYRFYTIFMDKDLFGFTCIHTCYGRIGTKGRLKSYAFDKTEQAETFLKKILKKRLSAYKRIGVDYKRVP